MSESRSPPGALARALLNRHTENARLVRVEIEAVVHLEVQLVPRIELYLAHVDALSVGSSGWKS
jgi:hypothetical protein